MPRSQSIEALTRLTRRGYAERETIRYPLIEERCVIAPKAVVVSSDAGKVLFISHPDLTQEVYLIVLLVAS